MKSRTLVWVCKNILPFKNRKPYYFALVHLKEAFNNHDWLGSFQLCKLSHPRLMALVVNWKSSFKLITKKKIDGKRLTLELRKKIIHKENNTCQKRKIERDLIFSKSTLDDVLKTLVEIGEPTNNNGRPSITTVREDRM